MASNKPVTIDVGERYFTAKETASILRYKSHQTVYRALRTGKIKGTKLGNQWRIADSEIRRALSDTFQNERTSDGKR